MTTLRDYAETMAGFYEERFGVVNTYAILVEHGEENEFTPLPEGETCGQAKNCYGNATHRALDEFRGDRPKLTYYEGLCFADFPIEHAWCQDADGRVYELTLRHLDDRCGFCDGEGKIHPADHWTADPADWEEIENEEETVDCEQCDGSGKAKPRDLSGTRYLGVPVDDDTLRAILMDRRVYGALCNDPKRVADALSGVTE